MCAPEKKTDSRIFASDTFKENITIRHFLERKTTEYLPHCCSERDLRDPVVNHTCHSKVI